MKGPPLGLLAAGGIGGAALLLAIVGAPTAREAAPQKAVPAAPPPSVTADGATLASAAIALPDDAEALPPGPHADLVAQRCTACHSAGMILTQPPLSAEQWQATVSKMRDVYRAPVPAGEEPAILAYLVQLKASPTAQRR